MSNEEYRQCITEMLYRMDRKEDNSFLRRIFIIVHRHFTEYESESLHPSDRYRSKVFKIINTLDEKRIKEIYYFLDGYI